MSAAPADQPRSAFRRAWPVVKWSLFAALLAFVGRRVWMLWTAQPDAFAEVQFRPVWLLPAALLYVAGWLPSVWFWRAMMARLGERVSFLEAARAYYCGHLGKYVPGKAAAIVIRAGMLKARGTGAAAAGVTAAYETLVLMAVGTAVGVGLAPEVLPVTVWEQAPPVIAWLWDLDWFRTLWTTRGAVGGIVAAIAAVTSPLFAKLCSIAAEKMVPDDLDGGERRNVLDARLLGGSAPLLVGAWWLHGLSLGCVVASVSGTAFDASNWTAWSAAAALGTSIGFLAIFAPGGAGIREWILIEVLRVQPGITTQAAVAAALLLRLTWLLTEVVTAGTLYWGCARRAASAGLENDNARRLRSTGPVEGT